MLSKYYKLSLEYDHLLMLAILITQNIKMFIIFDVIEDRLSFDLCRITCAYTVMVDFFIFIQHFDSDMAFLFL